ncbi:MAG: hypothetical protein GY950_20890 [bacterium]|nr:hypothetical protein [bacterium]
MFKRRIFRVFLLLLVIMSMGVMLTAQTDPGKAKKGSNYLLLFEMIDYTPQLKESLDYFFDSVYQKGDQVIIVTPLKFVGLTPQRLAEPKKKLIAGILKGLKNDIINGASVYRTILEDMKNLSTNLSLDSTTSSGGLTGVLQGYLRNRQNLLALRTPYEKKLLGIAKLFRRIKGDNHMLLFMQNVPRAIPERKTMENLQEDRRYASRAREAFLEENRKPGIDLEKITAAFKYAGVKIHFLYLKIKNVKSRRNVDYIDHNQDLYSYFSKLSKDTGGIKLTTAKASAFLKQVEKMVEGTVEVEVVDEKMKKEEEEKK